MLRDGRPVRVPVTTGLSDGTSIELLSGELGPADAVITGIETPRQQRGNMAPPPGMGGRH